MKNNKLTPQTQNTAQLTSAANDIYPGNGYFGRFSGDKRPDQLVIGVVVPALAESFFSDAYNAIEEVAYNNNYSIMIGQSLDGEDREYEIIEKMIKQGVAGIIISISKFTSNFSVFSKLKKANIPVVFFDRVPPKKEIHYVNADLDFGMTKGIDLLIEKGSRSIAFINGPGHLVASKERMAIYKRVLKENGININADYITSTDLTPVGNFKAMEQLLNLLNPPSAVVVFNDYVLLDCKKAVVNKGKAVGDFRFLSFANSSMLNYLDTKPLASVEQYPSVQGKIAVEILHGLITGRKIENHDLTPYQQISVDSSIVIYDNA